ncbi:hypothetical protein NCC49_005708 [Naganishia albida]|nr:hypothetical protein NCC49_005708 [Naganishia albida]
MTRRSCQSGSKEDDGGSADYDSFLQPLLHDLKVLATDGVDAKEYDATTGRLADGTFKLRAHLITICGDMPAVAKMMKFKGHNAIAPCRFCVMRAIPRKSGKTTTYYLTRRRPVSHENPDYADLPMRSHESVRRQADDIEGTVEDQAKKQLQIQYGIRGKTTPSQAVPRIGNIKNKSFWTAETYSYFLMFLGPIVLKDRLPEKYYKHFILLSEITKKLAMLEIEWDALEGLHKGIVRWVRAFEQLYYGFDPKYMPMCTAPIHALLHAVDCIRWQGPLCGYWCFALERFGGWIKSFAWRNNKDVVSWINNQLVQREQMVQLSLMLDRKDVRVVEAWEDYMNGKSGYQRIWHSRDQPERPDYTPAFFSKSTTPEWSMSGAMLRAIALHLETRRYDDDNYHTGHDYCPDLRLLAATHFKAWDAYDSSSDDGEQRYRCERLVGTSDGVRDASWVTYMQMVDKNERFRNLDARFRQEQQWGKVVKFLEFAWEGEDIRVAVLQSYRTYAWYSGAAEAPRGTRCLAVSLVFNTAYKNERRW